MKKIILLVTFSLLIAVSFLYCGKDKDNSDDPGNIPGMGDEGGELEVVTPFTYPLAPSIVGNITGVTVNPMPIENAVGAGGGWVILDILLENTTEAEAIFSLPGGSVIECQADSYQHAISIVRVDVSIEANSTKGFKLFVYCINRGRSGSSPDITYIIKGVTSSDRMMRLVEALENKKIDIRAYLPDHISEFVELSKNLQDIVWAITNDSGLSDDDWVFINSLANMPE